MGVAISHSAFLLTNFTAVINADYMLCCLTTWSTLFFLFKVIGLQFSKLIVRSLFFIYFLHGNCIKLAVTETSILFHLWSVCPNAFILRVIACYRPSSFEP